MLPPPEVVDDGCFISFVTKMKASVMELNGLPKETILGKKIEKIVINNRQVTEFDVLYLIAIRDVSNVTTGMEEKDWFAEISNNCTQDNNHDGNHGSDVGNHDDINNSNSQSLANVSNTVTTNNEDNSLRSSNETQNMPQGKILFT